VVARIGLTQARRLALLGERIDGLAAQKLGIVHFVSDDTEQMQSRLDAVLMQLKRCAPSANAVTKQLLHDVGEIGLEQLLDRAADNFCAALRGPEGQEGSSAFLQKRRPAWAK
jgi:isohexenylglutaconyl-CoA hydratase